MDHHAYYIEGSLGQFEALKDEIQPFVAQKFEKFGVDDARALVAQAALKRAGESVYLIGTSSITTEAQQALLKLFEEPRAGVVFVLLMPHGVLLPTLKSRMLEWPRKSLEKIVSRDFSAATIATLIKEDDKDKIRDYLNEVESQLSKKISDPKARQALEDIAMVRDYMRDRSPSLKMLLEHLALVI